jgi:hypothetical protein
MLASTFSPLTTLVLVFHSLLIEKEKEKEERKKMKKKKPLEFIN